MNSQGLYFKTLLFFLIVLFHSALTKSMALSRDEAVVRNSSSSGMLHALHLSFDGKLEDAIQDSVDENSGSKANYVPGLLKQSLRVGANGSPAFAIIETGSELKMDFEHDFSIEFWIRTGVDTDQRFVVLSQKQIPDNSLRTHKQKGWAFCVCNGTWAWNIGSGNRRLTYERDNGQHMPINDGRWHQLVVAYDHSNSLIRLYYDGINRATYNIADKDQFNFSNESPLTIGWDGEVDISETILPAIEKGAQQLQQLVDRFNQLGLGDLKADELMNVVIGPERLIRARRNASSDSAQDVSQESLDAIKNLVRQLSRNPYTVHQVADFMQVAPLLKLYRLDNGKIVINSQKAAEFTKKERFSQPEFDIDELLVWQRNLGPEEILQSYEKHYQATLVRSKKRLNKLTAATFNIHHGGKHETIEEDGWDSRETIADLIRKENIDVVMMQETYSSGDFIAAELGYYFATTVDWDYLNQGANISVLSRYPIKEIVVPPTSSFMNVAAKVSISETQDIYVMSNWYGMNNFQDVFDFHEARFSQSANIPVLFAGDFNAVPHTDGGRSPASRKLLEAGFHDAYRELYPDVEKYPGASHRGGSRIDQLYYKGKGLNNISTRIISTWPSKFPSDHYMIKSVFELNYSTSPAE